MVLGSITPPNLNRSLERIQEIYTDIAKVADKVMKSRCPYKDAKSMCTAMFACSNQNWNGQHSPKCTARDGSLTGQAPPDYRKAWNIQKRR